MTKSNLSIFWISLGYSVCSHSGSNPKTAFRVQFKWHDMDAYFITKFARQIISIIKRMGGKLLLVVLWVCSCVFEKLIKIQSAMPSRSFRRPTTLLLKVIYPKYYKHTNESCTFVVYGQIGPSGRCWVLLLIKYISNLLLGVFFAFFKCEITIFLVKMVKSTQNPASPKSAKISYSVP